MKKLTKWRRFKMKWRMLFIPDGPYGDRARGKMYEPYLKAYGNNFKVGAQAFIFNPNGLSVGDNVYIGFNSYLGQGEVELASEVLIGNFVSITATNHLIKGDSFRFGGFSPSKIKIGYGTWIGAQSSIVAGVEIGSSCLVASGSVVTQNVKDGIVVGGVPAKQISTVKKFKEKYNVE